MNRTVSPWPTHPAETVRLDIERPAWGSGKTNLFSTCEPMVQPIGT